MKKLIVFVCIISILIAGCGQQAATNPSPQQTANSSTPQPKPMDYTYEDVDQRLVEANTSFGFNLYHPLLNEGEGKNLFVSPLSIAIALSMTYNGASAETAEAMANALHVQDLSLEEVNEANRALMYVLSNVDPDVQVHIANSLWAREGKGFYEDFIQSNEEYYAAEVTELDFSAEDATETINQWVQEKTNQKIDSIIEEPIDADTILFLINAIYFKGSWSKPFDEELTREGDFYAADGSVKKVPMMRQFGEFEYLEEDTFQAIRLPYGDGSMSMDIFLPDENSSLQEFYQQLSVENWQKWDASFKKEEGTIRLPRFEMEYEVSLNNALKALGMEIAFDKNKANFEKMTSIPPNVYIDEVKHKTFLEVNEEGTEAAAVTSVESGICSYVYI